jgi:integrase/recombinase XerD
METITMALLVLKSETPSPLSRLVDDYLMSCRARGLSPRTDEQYSYALKNVFLRWCDAEGITRLEQLDRRTFDRYTSFLLQKRTRTGKPITAHAVHSFIRPVRIMLNWAKREGETIVAKPQLPRREKPVRDVLSRDEIDQLEQVMVNERDKLIIRVFADCGLRLDELTRLAVHDIIRSGRQAHFRVLGKRGRLRDVPIPPSLLRRLERFIEARPEELTSDRIFLTHRRRAGMYEGLTVIGVYQVVKDAFRRARITKPVYPHLLRHSWMTEMLRCGMNPIQLSFIAGASTDVIAQHYAHLTKDDAYEAMLRALTSRRN